MLCNYEAHLVYSVCKHTLIVSTPNLDSLGAVSYYTAVILFTPHFKTNTHVSNLQQLNWFSTKTVGRPPLARSSLVAEKQNEKN